ncbi:Methyltransferase domain-containing protein [Streptomyces sp. DvalAA-14]|uniref:class I SAM-dependent methyltransferase n=1 Tax=unclassified Streptomyces TaxID=2593676 RepID=UPI00081B7351|nr:MULTISPECIES: class I SAM-dependent methyltransferase [unclassified Streptomyces]MYS23752.1 methyltransferase domain-containing protein [Streptomyces sp. SID4948]SCE38280.1 Methyltransferase domain-containing protein [Streptomyces sp. DvalAA-14]
MTTSTHWKDTVGVADGFDAYDDLPERLIGYPAVFAAVGIGSPAVRTVLDYGCGPGKVAARIAAACDARVVAADISPRMLDIARSRRPHPRVDYREIDSGKLTFLADGSVDAAMSCYVFINVGDVALLSEIAAEIHRVLRPGARYAVLDTNPGTTGVRFSTFRSGEPGRSYGPGERRRVLLEQPGGGDPLELIDHHWPRQTYLDVLSEAGFSDLTVEEPLLTDPSALPGDNAAEATRPPFLIVSGVKQ